MKMKITDPRRRRGYQDCWSGNEKKSYPSIEALRNVQSSWRDDPKVAGLKPEEMSNAELFAVSTRAVLSTVFTNPKNDKYFSEKTSAIR